METESTVEQQSRTETAKTDRLKHILRLAAELTIVVWGLLVCNFSQIFGAMLSLTDHLQKLTVLTTLALPALTLLLLLPLTTGRARMATLAGLIAMPLCWLALAQPDQNMQPTGPIQNMLTIFAADHMAAVQRKALGKNSERILYAATSERKGLASMVREETAIAPGIRLVKIIHKPSETLFN